MLERFAHWWMGPEDGTPTGRRTHPALVAVLAAICLATAFVGVPRMRRNGHDIFVSLDGAWRVLHGQRPAVDFLAQMGPAYYLLHAAGLGLTHDNARGLGYGTTFVAMLISAWSVLLLRRRLSGFTLFVASITLVLLAVAPFALGDSIWDRGFAMKHNRYEYAFTGLVLLECFLPARDGDTRRTQFAAGFSSGFASALLLFLKISYGLVAVGLLVVSSAFRPRERARLTGIAAGLVCFLLPMLAYLRFDVPALLREYRLLAAVKGSGLSVAAILQRWSMDQFELSLVLMLAVVVSFLPGVPARRSIELLTATVLTIGAGTLLLLTNTQRSTYPLNSMLALILLNEVARRRPARPPLAAVALWAVGTLIVAVPLSLDASGLLVAVENKLRRPNVFEAGGYQLEGDHLAALEFYDNAARQDELDRNDNGRPFVEITDEGFNLLRQYSGPSESVRGMGMSNPFSYGLLRPPSRGGAVVISGTDVSESAVPPLELLVGDAQLLMIPKFPDYDRPTLEIVENKYPALLGILYAHVAESEHWMLYRRVRPEGMRN